MTEIPIRHYVLKETDGEYVASVFSFHVKTLVENGLSIEDVKKLNVVRIGELLKTAKAVSSVQNRNVNNTL